jgi:nitrogen-specific signal transduction histidine kinase
MRKVLTFFLLAFLLVNSTWAQSNRKTKKAAVKYNDHIVNEQHKVTHYLIRFYKALPKSHLTELQNYNSHLVAMIDESIKKISALPDFEGDKSLREAGIKWMNLYKSTLEKDFGTMLPLIANKNKTEAEKKQLNENKERLIKDEEAVDIEFEKAQVEFSKRHGLDLVEHPLPTGEYPHP